MKEIKINYPELSIKFGKSDSYESYTVLVDNSNIYNSDEFKKFEGLMIIEFIKKFNCKYGLFFTDEESYFEVDKIFYKTE